MRAPDKPEAAGGPRHPRRVDRGVLDRDKTEQCSDWERRPLTTDQVDYAAADAHVLTVLFDRCFNHAPAAVAEAIADPAAPLARAPGRTEADERTRSRAGGEKSRNATSRGRAAAAGVGSGRGSNPTFVAPPGPPPRPDEVPSMVGGTCSRGGSRWRRRSAAEKAAKEAAGGGADECGDFLALFVNGGRTNRRYANEFWVEEVPDRIPRRAGS